MDRPFRHRILSSNGGPSFVAQSNGSNPVLNPLLAHNLLMIGASSGGRKSPVKTSLIP